MNAISHVLKRIWKDEEGIGTLEVILILAVVVIVAIALPNASKL